MTKQEFIDNIISVRSEASEGLSDTTISEHVDAAIREYSERRPQEVWLRDQQRNSSSRYSIPNDLINVLIVRDTHTKRSISWEIQTDAETNEKQLVLGRIQVTSTDSLTNIPYYAAPYGGYYPYRNSANAHSYGLYDLNYSRVIPIEQVPLTDLNKLVLYVEHLGYDYQASRVSEHVKFTDTDVDGEETTIDNASVGKMYADRAKEKLRQFEKKLPIIFGTRDGTVDATSSHEHYYDIYGYNYRNSFYY